MKVFVTGASGFIGTEVVKELLAAGHQVLGLVRSETGVAAVEKLGAKAHRGSLGDLESLKSGVRESDAVIHLAFNHDFADFAANCAEDKQAILTLGEALVGKSGPLLVTSGTGFSLDGKPRTEEDPFNEVRPEWPRASEEAAGIVAKKFKVPVIVMRLPQVHNQEKFGLITYSIEAAKKNGFAAYIGEGKNRWPAVALADAAKLYRLALEKGTAGANYNVVGEEGVTAREIAEALGRGLKLPVKSISADEAPAHFGWLALFAGLDMPCSSALTQERLGWKPTGPKMIHDLDRAKVFESVSV
ncbi:MAG: SDR family oxidoreductase [Candidatus Obscuribacterales bacterium]|nr:SDR family oxidoreductase [Candidatus Obscuribacterales bacterium]